MCTFSIAPFYFIVAYRSCCRCRLTATATASMVVVAATAAWFKLGYSVSSVSSFLVDIVQRELLSELNVSIYLSVRVFVSTSEVVDERTQALMQDIVYEMFWMV